MSISSRCPRYREHLLAEGMHKILIRKAGQANGGAGALSNMKVVKFKEHAPKGFHLAATMEAVEGCGPPCAILNPRAGIEIQAQWMGAAGQKERATLSVGVKRALHCDAKLTFDDRVTAVFDSTAKATADDLLATLETLAVLREELPAALDNSGGELRKLSGPRNDLERGSDSRGEGTTEDGRDIEVRAHADSPQRDIVGEDVPDNDDQQPMASLQESNKSTKRSATGGGVDDSVCHSDARPFPLYDSPLEGTLGSAASRSTAKDEIQEPMIGLDRGNTSGGEGAAGNGMVDFGERDSHASASPFSDPQALPREDVPGSVRLRGTFRCDNQTQDGTVENGVDGAGELPHEVQRQGHGNRGGSGTSQAPQVHAQLPLHPSASTGSRKTSGKMRLTLVDALGDDSEAAKAREGSVDRPSSAADEALPHGAPSTPAEVYSESNFKLMLKSSQESPTSGLKAARPRVTSPLAKERRTAPQHPEPKPRRLGPKDESGAARDVEEEELQKSKMEAASRHVDSDSETVFQANDVFDDAIAESAPPDRRQVETEPDRKVSTLRGEIWECQRCTFINDEVHFRCGMCRAVRPREEYHLRSIRTPVPRFLEDKINQRLRIGGARKSKCAGPLAGAQSGESQDSDDLGDDAASSHNKPTRRKAGGGRCTNGAGGGTGPTRGFGQVRVGRPRRGTNGVGSPLRGASRSNGVASEAGVGSSRRSPPQSAEVAPGRRWMVQVSDSPSSDGRIEPSAGSILRMFVEWAATPDPSPFTLDTSILAEEASRGLNDTKTLSPIKKRREADRRVGSGDNVSGARVDACSSSASPRGEKVCDSSRKRQRLSENDVPFARRAAESDEELSDRDTTIEGTEGESNAAPAEASEAESEGIEYFEGDGFETEEDVDIPSKAVELDGSA